MREVRLSMHGHLQQNMYGWMGQGDALGRNLYIYVQYNFCIFCFVFVM